MKNAFKPLSLAILALTSTTAFSQSSVTLFGKIDSGLVRAIGSEKTVLGEGAQSRFGFRGVEDLGQGMKVSFALENRFRSNSGELTAVRFFQGQAILAIEGGWGRVALGRDYVAGYQESQITPDPFIHTGVSSMVAIGTGGIGTVRNDGAITYKHKLGDFGFSVQSASAVNPNSTTLPAPAAEDRPLSAHLDYKAGPIYLAFSHENPGGINDVWSFLAARAAMGAWTLSAGFGTGDDNTGNKRKSYMLGAAMKTESGRLKIAYGQLKNDTASKVLNKKFAFGYNHDLSKRTFLYANVARDQVAVSNKTGFDIGMQHNF